MNITDIHVDGFGVWNSMAVDELSDGVTLFFGRNEAGKTTLMQFLRAMFYGFSLERRRCYLPPVFGGVPGGMLRVRNHNGEFVIERRQSEAEPDGLGRAIVLAANGSRQGQHLLNVLLSGVDESIFNNVFAIGIRELQELATLNDTQAAEQLYNLASGIDRVSLVEVIRDLESQRRDVVGDDEDPGELATLVFQQEKLREEIAELESQTRRWFELGKERNSLAEELRQLEQQIARLERESRVVQISIQVRDKWRLRSDVDLQLRKIGSVEPLPSDCLSRLDELNLQIEEHKELLEPWHKRRREIKRELTVQPIHRALWEHSSRIEAVCEHGPWIASLENEIGSTTKEAEASELELMKLDEQLAAEGGVQLAQSPVVTQRIAQQLEAPAQSLRQARQNRAAARKHHKQQTQESNQAAGELRDELEGRPEEDFEQQLQKSGELVKQLRRRVAIEDRLDQMGRQRGELEQENERLLDAQLQGMRMLVAIGIMFVFGFVLLMTGVFGVKFMPMPNEIAWGVGALGVFCMCFSATWKAMAERAAQEELNNVANRLDTLDRELDETLQDREQLDRELPPGAGTFSSRLTGAERDLKELETKAPLHFARNEAKHRSNSTKRHVTSADEELKDARSRWRRALRNFSLPETLDPKQVRRLAAHHQRRGKVQTQVNELRERLGKLHSDRDALVARLRQLNQDVGLTNISPDPQVQLSQLSMALSGQREMVIRRRELKREDRELRQHIGGGSQKLRRFVRAREALFAEYRVTDETDLRARWQKLQDIAKLNDRRKTLAEQISAIVGAYCGEEEIEQELSQGSKEELESRHRNLVGRLQESQNRLGQMFQRRGEINQEMKSLGENRRLAEAKFELGCLDTRITRAIRRWQTAGIMVRLLEVVRDRYEAERQPETLSEASLYLEKFTEGKYTRIWTPLGEHELRVDDHEGRPMALELLSRGTREAVFLSLRLALVASYGRRGVNIPLVLDDVLVNIDTRRSEAAVQALCDFAKEGRQLLFFTCHDHIKSMFEAANVDVRALPPHGTPGVRVSRQEPATEIPPPAEPEVAAEISVAEQPAEVAAEVDLDELPPLSTSDTEYSLKEPAEVETTSPLFELADYLLASNTSVTEPVAAAPQEPEPEETPQEVDVVFNELDDDHAFEDSLWWEPNPRSWVAEEPAA